MVVLEKGPVNNMKTYAVMETVSVVQLSRSSCRVFETLALLKKSCLVFRVLVIDIRAW